jgi:predicted dehydrogenase
MDNPTFTRRHLFYGALLAGALPAAGFGSSPSLKRLGYKSPNEKLNIATVGAGGRAEADIHGCATENFVAFSDPDDARASRTFQQYPNVPKYKDFRRMFDKQSSEIDAVIVACPDHVHASAAMWAMTRGKHVYCEKPLTRTVWEAQQLTLAAEKYGVATQMGNQGYSNEGTRQCAEMIWAGEIGGVTEVHAWTNRPWAYWPQGPEVVPEEGPVPATLDWEAWLADSPPRPYSPAYVPHNWRAFPEFGCGAIGDMACHILGPANMALRPAAPTSVECILQEGKGKYTFPKKATIRFDFPARSGMPPVKIFWHDGLEKVPDFPGVPPGEKLGDDDVNGSLFMGEKGMITTGTYGDRTRLLPAERMKDYKFPAWLLPRSPMHPRDWIRACKGGAPACSNFGVAGPFVQWMLLGVIAMKFEGKLEWDAAKGRFSNNNAANEFLKPKFRKGWKFA